MNETISLHQYVRHEDRQAFESVGWTLSDDLSGTHHGEHAVLMTRDMPEIAENRVSVTTANPTYHGEIELIALVNGKELILTMPRKVVVAIIANLARALAER